MKKSTLDRILWIFMLVGLLFASFGSPTGVLAQGNPPVDPTGPPPGDEASPPIIPNTGGEPVVENVNQDVPTLSGGRLVAVLLALAAIMIVALLVTDGFVNKID